MQSSVRLEISDEFFTNVDRQLAKLENINRAPALERGGRKAMNLVKASVRSTLPKPGYPGDKPGLTPLRDTLLTKVVWYANRFLVFLVGYSWYGGQHGHIVEHGHRIATGGTLKRLGEGSQPRAKRGITGGGTVSGFVEGRFYLQKAAERTKDMQLALITESIEQAIRDTEQT